jgi:HlyD family secretion protein
MIRKYVLPLLAVAGVLFAIWTAVRSARPVPPAAPVAEPPRPSFQNKISGSGIVEASTRNIAIGTHVSGIVTRVFVKVGDRVQAQDPLFVLDDRTHQAELGIREAAVKEALARLKRLKAAPRPEEVPIAEARVKEAEAVVGDLQQQLEIVERIRDRRAVSIEDINKRRYAVAIAQARLTRAKADLALLKAGSWQPDTEVAKAALERTRAELEAARIEMERLTVRAPVEGQVLQVNIRPGEFAQSGVLSQPLILLGSVDRLHVRVDIDENDAWRFSPEAPAVAYLRGHAQYKTDLTFEYVERYVIPKRSLTGESTERVDTRVLQVVYSFPRENLEVYAGQQMDVYIEDQTPKHTDKGD